MKAIAAVSEKWGIGKDNKLLFHLREDMDFFRETTTGNVVVMGRKTLESFPGGQPLKNRVNIVLSKDPEYNPVGCVVVHSIEELREEIKKYDKEIYVIGGGSVYKALLPYIDTALITRIYAQPEADTFFPNLDKDKHWEIVDCTELKSEASQYFRFVTYKKRHEKRRN